MSTFEDYLHEEGNDKDLTLPDDELEVAPTREQYYRWESERETSQMSFEEQQVLTQEILHGNMEAMQAAIFTLIGAHPTEFEHYLQEERKARGIDDKVRSSWKDYLDSTVEKNTRVSA